MAADPTGQDLRYCRDNALMRKGTFPVVALSPILVIEDDLDQLSALTAMLSREPYPLLTAMTGERALDVLPEISPALVVVRHKSFCGYSGDAVLVDS